MEDRGTSAGSALEGTAVKILQINKLYHPVVGGIETIVRQTAEGINNTGGFTVDVLVCNDRFKTTTGTIRGVFVTRASSIGKFYSMPVSIRFISLLKKMWRRYDVLHVHLPFPLGELALWLIKPKTRIVVTYHSDIVRQRLISSALSWLHTWVLGHAESIAVSNPNIIESSQLLKNFKTKCTVIPFGVDTNRFNPPTYPPDGYPAPLEKTNPSYPPLEKANPSYPPLEKGGEGGFEVSFPPFSKELRNAKERIERIQGDYGKRIVLFVGRLVYYKGVEYLIRAMKGIDARLVIIGEGPLKQKLLDEVRDNGLVPAVTFLPYQPQDELADYYRAASVFVLPSIYKSEAFGITIIEAMACGLPVISTELGTGTSYANQDGRTGFVVPPRDTDAIHGALIRLLSDTAVLSKMGRAAAERVRTEFTMERMLNGYKKLYTNMHDE